MHADVLTQGTEPWRTWPLLSHLEVAMKEHPVMSSKAKVHTLGYCKLHRGIRAAMTHTHPRQPCTEQDTKPINRKRLETMIIVAIFKTSHKPGFIWSFVWCLL